MISANSSFIVEGSARSVRGRLCTGDGACPPHQDLETYGGLRLFGGSPGGYTLELAGEWRLEGASVRATFTQEVMLVAGATGAAATDVSVADVAEVVCTDDGVRVGTPSVLVQPDGLHVHVTGDGVPAKIVELQPSGRGSITLEFAEKPTGLDSTTTLVAPPGPATVTCLDAGEPRTGQEAVAIELVDASEAWHPESMSCPQGDGVLNSGGFWFYDDVNSRASGIARSVPGILPTDELSYGAYPGMDFERWRVVRDGSVVATMDLSTYDERVFVVSAFSCPSSRIGEEDAPILGKPATPFRLNAYGLCDPYVSSCASVFVSVQWYTRHVGALTGVYTVPPAPWVDCSARQPEGCSPGPAAAPLEVLLTPTDASAFIEENGCGITRESMCNDDQPE